ncbi:major facilitator superfamily domain-containing protein [Immersiella caudata]|uniref:Major facilitator superfamily domain-containing protein n=1 Tax=Immersiella caudata TaxID=314043 RepID=A0AA39WYG5_9PEZI|nr:major facilitator superfamily domain-containing protein [Immersiella caudata]
MATQTTTELSTLSPISTPLSTRKRDTPIPPLQAPHPLSPVLSSHEQSQTTILPKGRAILVTIQLCGLLFLGSFTNGIIVVALPSISTSLSLPKSLFVWPTSSYYLAAGTCLLLGGSLADVLGNKRINLVGSLLSAIFTFACGVARTGNEIIAFRALQGVTYAAVMPSGVSIVSTSLEEGRPRNMGFGCLGFSQPLGFCFGLVMGGVFTDTVGWRPACYFAGAVSAVLCGMGWWVLPGGVRGNQGVSRWKRMSGEIDWVGLGLASSGLAMFSYTLAALSADIDSIKQPSSIALLTIAGLCLPAFAGWMHRQEKRNRIALIPNSLWGSHVFTSACIMVLLSNALANCMEVYSSLFFQEVQLSSAMTASLQVIPSLIAGVITSILTGMFVHRIPVLWTLLASSLLSTVAPLLMALIRTDQPYWENAFFGQILTPISCDLLFTVGLLIVSDTYPKHMQALGGAVFNTCAQIGSAIGLSVTQVIASSVTAMEEEEGHQSPEGLMKGYRVAFWVMFGWMVFVCLVCLVGMRRVGRIGLKRD